MPRGRPPKNKQKVVENSNNVNNNVSHSLSNIRDTCDVHQNFDEHGNLIEEPRKKRKYVRKQKPEQNKSYDNIDIKLEAKKRGRKRGRKRKEQDFVFKPEDIMDYVIRNFPQMRMDIIKTKVVDGLKLMKDFDNNPYLLTKFIIDNQVYYYDDKSTIVNPDGQVIGYFIKQADGSNRMYPINPKNSDDRSYGEIIDWIEKGVTKFKHNYETYYYDNTGAIFDSSDQIVGYYVKQSDGLNKMYLINPDNDDNRTYDENITSIENNDITLLT
jgi:hypothetical protein